MAGCNGTCRANDPRNYPASLRVAYSKMCSTRLYEGPPLRGASHGGRNTLGSKRNLCSTFQPQSGLLLPMSAEPRPRGPSFPSSFLGKTDAHAPVPKRIGLGCDVHSSGGGPNRAKLGTGKSAFPGLKDRAARATSWDDEAGPTVSRIPPSATGSVTPASRGARRTSPLGRRGFLSRWT